MVTKESVAKRENEEEEEKEVEEVGSIRDKPFRVYDNNDIVTNKRLDYSNLITLYTELINL